MHCARADRGVPEHVFERSVAAFPDAVALECGHEVLTYAELDRRANQLAHLLRGRRIGHGDRVALLLERSTATYVALLGVLKSGAAFVPIDPESPADRVDYVVDDADVDLILTSSDLAAAAQDRRRRCLVLDEYAGELGAAPTHRPAEKPRHGTRDADPAAYVICTSGSSGRPTGVEVTRSSIVNFLDVVPAVYDVRPGDRVYQGMTISFDFSLDEIWPTWAVGATLVAGPTDERRLGADLADFLDQARISVLYCVPTLLATAPRDLPGLRAIMVGGEACPAELVERLGHHDLRHRRRRHLGRTTAAHVLPGRRGRPAAPRSGGGRTGLLRQRRGRRGRHPFGAGRVGVVGPHPEADATWYSDAELTNPDGIRPDLGHDLVERTLSAVPFGPPPA